MHGENKNIEQEEAEVAEEWIETNLCFHCFLIVKAWSPTEIFKLLLGPFPSRQQQLEEVLRLKLF